MSRTEELFRDPCVLCGCETCPTAMSLVEWITPIDGVRERYATVPRCVDRPACRRRVEIEVGEPWPVNDRTPAPVRPAEPEPAVDEAAADSEEAVPWL